MPVFFDRSTGELHDYGHGSPEALSHVYGSGQTGFGQMFPGEQSSAVVPWSRAGGLRGRAPYEQEKVNQAIQRPESQLRQVDPRRLVATQGEVTRAGVEHYMSEDYRRSRELFADRSNPGNRHPVVYARTHPETGHVENLLLSGHHRATAALLRGKSLRAHFVEGGFGSEYQ